MLPPGFPIDKLSATDRHKVEWFYGRYVEQYYGHYKYGHFLMAAYAAVPGLLTPDMLYKMWQNFNAYTWSGKPVTIHRIAVSDILLSPLCHDVGYELYEMHQDIRLAFLEWLKVEADDSERVRGFRPIEVIGHFLQEYYQRPNPGSQIWGEHYLDTQQLDVLSFFKPEKVAALLKTRITNAANERNETSLLRAIDAFTKTHKRLERVLPEQDSTLQEFKRESQWLEAGRALVQQHFGQFAGLLDAHRDLSNWVTEKQEGALPVKIERSVMSKLKEAGQPKLWALVVGADDQLSGRRTENDALLMENGLRDIMEAERLEMKTVIGAGKEMIMQYLAKMAADVSGNDIVFIYFSCNSTPEIENPGSLWIGEQEITYKELNTAISELKSRQVVLMLEMPFPGTHQWMNIAMGMGRAVITSSYHSQQPYDQEREPIQEKAYSFFTYEFVRQLKRKQGQLSIRSLMCMAVKGFETMPQVRALYGESAPRLRNEHAPQIWASPEMMDATLLPDAALTARLQVGLQREGYYHDYVDGVMNGDMERAINEYRRDFLNNREMEKSEVLLEIEQRSSGRHEKPVFLLLFSDPHKRLKFLEDEQAEIGELLSAHTDEGMTDFVILNYADKKTLSDFLTNIEYRDRVELFYYSGLDEAGNMVLEDGTFPVFDLIPLLEFQRNMQVVFLNTCNSAHAANWIAQMAGCRALGGLGTVDDGYSAEFGVSFFKDIIKGGSWEEYEQMPMAGDLRMEDAPQGVIRYFQAPWIERGQLMSWKFKMVEKKEQKEQKKTNTIRAVCLGINQEPGGRTLEYCNDNAGKFGEWLTAQREQLQKEVKVNVLPGATRAVALSAIDELAAAEDGDTCVIFYSGVLYRKDRNNEDDEFCFGEDADYAMMRADSFVFHRLVNRFKDKNVNLIVICDVHGYLAAGRGRANTTPNRYDGLKHFVLIKRELSTEFTFTAGNEFFTELLDVLHADGGELTYQGLLDRLRIKMLSWGERLTLSAKTDVRNWQDHVVFTNRLRKNVAYYISFNKNLNSWVANAGLRNGLKPSVNFTGTYFYLQDGSLALIGEVGEDYSLLTGLEGRAETESAEAMLVERKIPEVRVAFSKNVPNQAKTNILQEIERQHIPYIDFVYEEIYAYYVIDYGYGGFYLTFDLRRGDPAQVLESVKTEAELVKQMQSICEWMAMVDYYYPGRGIKREDLNVTFLVADELKQKRISEREFSEYQNPSSILLSRNIGAYPALMCNVSIAEGSSLKECYVRGLYFDRGFDVHDITTGVMHLRKGDVITIDIDRYIMERVNNNVFRPGPDTDIGEQGLSDYVRLFVSTAEVLSVPVKKYPWRQRPAPPAATFPVNADVSINVPVFFDWGPETPKQEQTFRQKVQGLYESRKVAFEDDPQKNRWGGESTANNWMLHASVKRKNLIPGFYSVTIYADFKGDIPPGTEVAFFLHDSFDEEIKYTTVEKGRALINVSAYEAFTTGAYTSDGTMLELDLNNAPGFPDGFYYQDVMDVFKSKVKELYNSTPVRIKDDLQKGRWGGAFHVNGKALSASVKKSLLPGLFKIKLRVASTNNTPLMGDVAFFIHDSFNNQIKFRRALNGEASVSVTAYEAFAVGAYTEDGTLLELDLNQVKDAPEGFYYKER
ncbi:pYEATS domain-containing protein [uncultured Chitinophaga sp.]|uniref:pYEATS domain-containing protein n=1 Tax=uncultured Chitinophaga sp. TaxID=339340 RepID=UPI0025D83E3F|nr:pYEATS domain-containing protein [uncultured Chitinophaga sp.]